MEELANPNPLADFATNAYDCDECANRGGAVRG